MFFSFALTHADDPPVTIKGTGSTVRGSSGENRGIDQTASSNDVGGNIADPDHLIVPCTDESKPEPPVAPGAFPSDYEGPSEFGQIPCTVAKKNMQDSVTKKVQQMIAYYYEGVNTEFMNADPGFCKANAAHLPVCELGVPGGFYPQREYPNNWKTEQCGKSGLTIPPGISDHQCFTTRPPDLAQCGAERFAIYTQEISDFQKLIAAYKSSSLTYERALATQKQAELDDVNKFADVYVQPEWDQFKTHNGGFCAFSQDGFNPDTCNVERSWLSGIKVSIWQYVLEEIRDEIAAGEIKLSSFGGTKPCAELAQSVERQLNGDPLDPENRPGIRASEDWVRTRYKTTVDKLNTKVNEGCLGLDPHHLMDLNAAMTQISKLFIDFGSGIQTQQKQISSSVCNLMLMRLQTLATTEMLAMCEVSVRTKADLYENVLASKNIWTQLKARVTDPCFSFAHGKKDFWGGCWTDCVVGWFNKCYQGGVPSVSSGVQRFFYDYVQGNSATGVVGVAPYKTRWFSASNPPTKLIVPAPPPPLPPLPGYPTPPPPPPPKYAPGVPIPDSMVPNCTDVTNPGIFSGSFLIPFVAGRRKRRQPRGRRTWLGFMLGLLLAGLAVVMVFGLGCDDSSTAKEDPQEYPCPGCGRYAEVSDTDHTRIKCLLSSTVDCQTASDRCREECHDSILLPPFLPTLNEKVVDQHVENNGNARQKLSDTPTIAEKGSPPVVAINEATGAATADIRRTSHHDSSTPTSLKATEGFTTSDPNAPTAAVTTTGPAPGSDSGRKPGADVSLSGGGAATAGAAASAGGTPDAFDAAHNNVQNARGGGHVLVEAGGFNGEGSGGGAGRAGGVVGSSTGEVGAPGPDAAAGNGDAYLNANRKLSLFEVVSKRYSKWSWQLENGDLKARMPSSNGASK